MSSHSQKPWRADSDPDWSGERISDANGDLVTWVEAGCAEEIVRCVNVHESLVQALKWALTYGTFDVSNDNPLHGRAHLDAIAALRYAEDSHV